MQSQRKYWTVLLIFTLLLSSCAGNAQTEDPNTLMTSAVGTMVAGFFETQTAMVTPSTLAPTATETKFPTPTQFATSTSLNSPTATFLLYSPTKGTPTVTGTLPTATVNAAALANGCYNLAFVRDVNYPSGTVVNPGQSFTKTWKVENNGSCNWLFVYKLAFVSGTDFDPNTGQLGRIVTPGNWAELSVNLDAPTKPGTYSAYWRFSNGGTTLFGATLGVTIKVSAPTNTPTSTILVNTNTVTSTTAPANTNTATQTTAPATATFTETPTETLTTP